MLLQVIDHFNRLRGQRAGMPAFPAANAPISVLFSHPECFLVRQTVSLHKFAIRLLAILIIIVAFTSAQSSTALGQSATRTNAQTQTANNDSIEQARLFMEEIRQASYPELLKSNIRVKSFRSSSDYFQSNFDILRFFFHPRMRYTVKANPAAFEQLAPEPGLKAIIAHELAHTFYYKKGIRLRLFKLVCLVSKGFTARFERWADLQTISRGYGEGLKEYRLWLYKNIPAEKLKEKQRNYFSPEEIDAILSATQKHPGLMDYWLKHVPRNLEEIMADEKRYEAKPGSRQ